MLLGITILISNNGEKTLEYERLIKICVAFFIILVVLALKWYYVMTPIH